MRPKRPSISLAFSALLLSTAAMAQAPLSQTVPPDWKTESAPTVQTALDRLASEMPSCTEFRNDCIVCRRTASGPLACSNIGIACHPQGEWRCTIQIGPEQAPK